VENDFGRQAVPAYKFVLRKLMPSWRNRKPGLHKGLVDLIIRSWRRSWIGFGHGLCMAKEKRLAWAPRRTKKQRPD